MNLPSLIWAFACFRCDLTCRSTSQEISPLVRNPCWFDCLLSKYRAPPGVFTVREDQFFPASVVNGGVTANSSRRQMT